MPRCQKVKAYGQTDMQVNNKLHHKVKAYGQINMLSQQQASSYRLVTQKRSWLIKKGRSPPVPLTCLIWEYQQVNQKKVQPITQAYDCQHLIIEISNNKVHNKENHILRSTSSSEQTFIAWTGSQLFHITHKGRKKSDMGNNELQHMWIHPFSS